MNCGVGIRVWDYLDLQMNFKLCTKKDTTRQCKICTATICVTPIIPTEAYGRLREVYLCESRSSSPGVGGTGMEQCSMVSLIRGKLLDTITRPEILGIAQQIGRMHEALLESKIKVPVQGALATGRWDPGVRCLWTCTIVIDPINKEWWVGEKKEDLFDEMTGLSMRMG